jgi:hypothetical protein
MYNFGVQAMTHNTEIPDCLAVAEQNLAAINSYVTLTKDEIRTLFEGESLKNLRNQLICTDEQRKAGKA